MKLKSIIAEYLYYRDMDNKISPFNPSVIKFEEQDSNVKDFYSRLAEKKIPEILGGYFRSNGQLANLIRGSIQDFINCHGVQLTKENHDSLVRRIVSSIRGIILS